MDFKLVSKTQATRVVREGTYPQEIQDAAMELWQIQQEHGETHVTETAPFESEKAAQAWMNKIQAYGKTQGIFISRARGYVPSEPNSLVLTVEALEDRQKRIAARKARDEEIAEMKERGEEVPRGVAMKKVRESRRKAKQQNPETQDA